MTYDTDETPQQAHKVDRLLDAIDLIKADERQEARPILRSIIQEDSNFEDAWLWMSLAVDEIDQSIICLDNVLRINPDNVDASTALYHLRQAEFRAQKKRSRLRQYRDLANTAFWALVGFIIIAVLLTYRAEWLALPPA